MRTLPGQTFRGSFVPLVTPFADGDVDDETFMGLVDWHAGEGSHGVVIGSASIGEALSLTLTDRRRMIDMAVDAADGRLAVLVATETNDHGDSAALVDHAERAGADGLVLVGPHDVVPLARRTQLPAFVHRRRRSDASAEDVDVSMLERLADVLPVFAGVIDSSKDAGFATEAVMAIGPDLRILADADELTFQMFAAGAHGSVCSIANVLPAHSAALYYAATREGLDEGRAAQQLIWPLSKAVRLGDRPVVIKHMMWRLGLLASPEHRAGRCLPDTIAVQLDALLVSSDLFGRA